MAAIPASTPSGRFTHPLTVAITSEVSSPLASASAHFARIKTALGTQQATGDAMIRAERETADLISDLQALRMQLRGAIAKAGSQQRAQDKANAQADERTAAIREARGS